MATAEPQLLTRIFITQNPLVLGRIVEVMAQINGDNVSFRLGSGYYILSGEGENWHLTLTAARNYATQVQMVRLRELRDEVERLERMDFGRR